MQKSVVLVNPSYRTVHLIDFYKKYNFKPIIVLFNHPSVLSDLYASAVQCTKIIKKSFPITMVIKDNGNDFDKVFKQLKKLNVVAVIPYETSTIYTEKLREKLGLKNNDPSLSIYQKDKGWVNEQLVKNGIRVPITLEYDISKISAKDSFLKQITSEIKSFPIVIKPFEGAGGIGVSIAKNLSELKSSINLYLETAKKYSATSAKVLFQQYIGGEEYFLNYQSINGKHLLTDVWKYEKMQKRAYTLHHIAYTLSSLDKTMKDADKYCKQVLDAIKWKWGATHIEIKIVNGLAYLIEVNLRNMGAHSVSTTPIFFNYSTPELCYLSLVDNSPLIKYFKSKYSDSKKNRYSAIYLVNAPRTFTLKKENIINWAKKNLKTFNDYQPYYNIGDKIPEAISLFDGLVGEVGLYGPEKQVRADILKLEKVEKENFNLLFE